MTTKTDNMEEWFVLEVQREDGSWVPCTYLGDDDAAVRLLDDPDAVARLEDGDVVTLVERFGIESKFRYSLEARIIKPQTTPQ